MNGEEIRIVLEKHEKWLNNELGGIRADLSGADIYGLDLRGANLYGANLIRADLRVAYLIKADLREASLSGANLIGADLYEANLSGANLYGANLRGANLRGANLSGADLYEANLSGADLSGADLREANLSGANLSGANLSGADLRGADLRGADLSGANLRLAKNIPSYVCHLVCPEEGSFIGFKKAHTPAPDFREAIVKLLITEDAKRSSATTRKCRCDKAKVISITSLDGKENFTTAYSYYDRFFQYTVGQTVIIDDFDEERWDECSTGVHFFITREEAVDYVL